MVAEHEFSVPVLQEKRTVAILHFIERRIYFFDCLREEYQMMRNGVTKRYIYRQVLRRRLSLLEWTRGHWHHSVLFYIYNTILYCFTCISFSFILKVSRESCTILTEEYQMMRNGVAKRYIYRQVLRRRLYLLEWARGHWHHSIFFFLYI